MKSREDSRSSSWGGVFGAKSGTIGSKLTVLLFTFFCLAAGAFAQTKTVKGMVADKTGEPVIGASVTVKGTTQGIMTDVAGLFTLKDVPSNGTLRVSYIGYKAQDVALAGKTSFNIVLEDEQSELDEVVVVGYGVVKKRDLTGSVASINHDALTAIPVTDVSQAMQGKLPGVTVVSQDGRPGAEVTIRVRGGGSVTQSNDPLYIVDGFPVSSISDIPADQIETMDVLKDASSTAIYGARGANGVILITTKGVKDEKVKITYSGYVQTKSASKTLDVMNAQEYLKYWWGYTTAYGASNAADFAKYYGLGAANGNHYDDYANVGVHNYTDDILRTAFSHNHNLNIAGGTEKTKIVFNANYMDDEGIKINSDFRRTNLSLKVQQKLAKTLVADFDVRYNSSRLNGTEGDVRNSRGSVLSAAYWYLPIDNPLGGVDFSDVSSGFGLGSDYIDKSKGTPEELINDVQSLAYRENLRGSGALTWDIIDGLKLRSELGYSRGHDETDYYEGGLRLGYKNAKVTKSDKETFRSVTTLDYAVKGLGKNNSLSVLLGNEYLRSESNTSYVTGNGYPDNFDFDRAIGLINMYTIDGSFANTLGTPSKTVSFFARANYSLLSRYLLTATFRADGSSKFAANNRWGYFPAAALAWRLSDEPFMDGTDSWLDNLKVRLSVGTAGSDNIDASLWQETWVSKVSTVGGETTTVFQPEGLLPNEDLKWETTISRNLGVDFGFFNNRIYGSVDAYSNETKDLLMRVPIDETTGYSYQFKNIGKTSNKGFEISLGADIIRRDDFRLNVSATYNYNRNKIKELQGDVTTLYGTQWASSSTSPNYDYTFAEGKAVGLIRAYASEGYYKTSDFNYDASTGVYTLREGVSDMPSVDKGYGSYPKPEGIKTPDGQLAFPGAMKLRDADGDGVADIEELETTPRHTGGFTITANYKQFDFSAGFNWVAGGHIYNVGALLNMYGNGNSMIGANRLSFVNKCYQYYSVQGGELVAATTPAELDALNGGTKYYSNYLANGVTTTDFIEDGSYLRLQNLTVGYTLPKKLTQKACISRLRVYVTGGNLFTITGYDGLDPEVNALASRTSNTANNAGGFPTTNLDMGAYPRARTFTLGLNLEF